jgi:Carboxypeptidase regulatory-like domain
MRLLRDISIFVVALSFSLSLGATRLSAQTQTTGSLVGAVADPSNAGIPNATVTLTSLTKGTMQTAKTDASGNYAFSLLDPGTYSISASAAGFESLTQKATVALGQVTTANLKLQLGAQTQSVTVEAQAEPLVQADNGNVASNISEVQAANVPNPGNDLTYIAQLAPGATMNTGMGYGNTSMYGISAASNLYTINGMNDNDPFFNINDSGATNLLLGENEVEEVSVVTNGYSGQFGGLAGANINVVTRSGTNQFHGRAIWYWNGRTMNANNWFNNASGTPRSFVNANQYGADFGGPIVKDKLFFYTNFEGLYLAIPTSEPTYIPSPAFESAVTTYLGGLGNATQLAFYENMFSLYNAANGAAGAINNLPEGGCDGSESDFPVTGFGSIPALPCALQFRSTATNLTHENLQAYRVDWNVTNNDRMFFRYQHDLGVQATNTDPISPLFNDDSIQPEDQGQLEETHTFSSGAVNQLILSGQWYSALFVNDNPSKSSAAFPTTLQFASGQFSNLGGIDFVFPQGRNITQFQFSDDFSKIFGNHTFKIGLSYRRDWTSDHDYPILQSGLTLPITLDAFFRGGADVVNATAPNGAPNLTELIQSFPTFTEAPFAGYGIGGYVEDDWRLRPSFTLTLAFRLDHGSNPICFTNCFPQAAAPYSALSTDPATPYTSLISVGQRQLVPSLQSVEPQPRLGFAWEVAHNTVVRGGAGIFYDSFPAVLLDATSENPPNDPTFTILNGTISSPGDPTSLFATGAAADTAFQAAFKSGGSFSSISATNPSFSAPNLTLTVPKAKVMQYQKWNLDVQHQFGTNTSIDLGYVGNHGVHIFDDNSGVNACNVTGTFASLPACNPTTGAGINPSFLEVQLGQTNGVASYNGFTASFTHRYASGVVQLNYTWSHGLDDVSNSGALPFIDATNESLQSPEDPANLAKYNYGSADYDARHQLSLNYVWELPIKKYLTFGHGPSRLTDGWTVSGDMFLRTGFPITPYDGGATAALAGGGYGGGTAGNTNATVFGTELTPGAGRVNCASIFDPTGAVEPSRGNCYNPADFTTSPDGFGNVARNSLRGPGFWNTDFSLMKHTKITERLEFIFGAQFYNVFNHPNFDAPVMDTSSTLFGQITQTVSSPTTVFGSFLGADGSPRLIQFKTELQF